MRDRGRTAPARPALPIAFACAMPFWLGCALSFSACRLACAQECLWAVEISAAACVAVAIAGIATRGNAIALAALALAVGCFLGCAEGRSLHIAASTVPETVPGAIEVTLSEDSKAGRDAETAFGTALLPDGRTLEVLLSLPADAPLLRGARIACSGSLSQADFGRSDYLWRNGAVARLSVSAFEELDAPPPLGILMGIRAEALDAIGSADAGHALMQALACGYRHDISQMPEYAQFQTCGLAHLVAVSGAHLVIVTGLAASALRSLRVPWRVSIGILLGAMGAYLVLSGMPVSAVRAAIMSSIGILALFGKRRPSSLNALGLGVFAIVGSSPSASLSASFILSALSTAGIVLFAPLVRFWLASTPLDRAPFAADALSLTVGAAIPAQLYACSLFSQLPLMAPVANVVTAPLFPVACGLGLAAGALGAFIPLGPLAAAAALPAKALMLAVSFMSSIPFASVPVSIEAGPAVALSAVTAAILWLAWPLPGKGRRAPLLAAALIAALALLPGLIPTGDAIVMLDVGQGDSFLITSQGQTLLIDTGNQDTRLLAQLAENRIAHLDSVLVTHRDDDHCGSLDALARAVDIDRVLVANDMLKSSDPDCQAVIAQARRAAREAVGLSLGDRFEVGSFTAQVIWPASFADEGGNADSLCLLVEYDGDGDGAVDFTSLFTGDAEAGQLARMLQSGSVGDIDVLKVGHHGSRNGMTAEEARQLAPEIALIGVGEGNRYGHPAQEILEMLAEEGCAVFRSDEDGQVRCAFSAEGISVSRMG